MLLFTDNSTATEVPTEDEKVAMEKYFTPTFIFSVAGVGCAAIVVILLLFLLCHRIQKHRFGYNPTNTQEINIDLNKLPSNMAYHR